jgi:mono/diheme cytochrome c family protein
LSSIKYALHGRAYASRAILRVETLEIEMKRSAALIAALMLAAPAFADEQQAILHGKALVVENCSGCHAIGNEDTSPNPKSPPFRTLSQRYPLDALEEAFVEGIDTGHPEMPRFIASPEQIADIIAYIGTLNP